MLLVLVLITVQAPRPGQRRPRGVLSLVGRRSPCWAAAGCCPRRPPRTPSSRCCQAWLELLVVIRVLAFALFGCAYALGQEDATVFVLFLVSSPASPSALARSGFFAWFGGCLPAAPAGHRPRGVRSGILPVHPGRLRRQHVDRHLDPDLRGRRDGAEHRRRPGRASRPRLRRLPRRRRLQRRAGVRSAFATFGWQPAVLDRRRAHRCLRRGDASASSSAPPPCGCAATTWPSSPWASERSSGSPWATSTAPPGPTSPTAPTASSPSPTCRSGRVQLRGAHLVAGVTSAGSPTTTSCCCSSRFSSSSCSSGSTTAGSAEAGSPSARTRSRRGDGRQQLPPQAVRLRQSARSSPAWPAPSRRTSTRRSRPDQFVVPRVGVPARRRRPRRHGHRGRRAPRRHAPLAAPEKLASSRSTSCCFSASRSCIIMRFRPEGMVPAGAASWSSTKTDTELAEKIRKSTWRHRPARRDDRGSGMTATTSDHGAPLPPASSTPAASSCASAA